MIVLGLTGSIGMGKTVVARMFAGAGAAVFDADATAHELIGPGGAAVDAVGAVFAGSARDGPGGREIDRAVLAARVFDDAEAIARLEAVLHPRIRRAEMRFLRRAARRRCQLAVLDVPLLLETGGDSHCDAVAVVRAPAFLQRQRVLARPGMTPERLAAIRTRQMPDADKLRRADFVITTGLSHAATLRQVRRIVRMLTRRDAAESRSTAATAMSTP